jgi:hypothetical protein
MPSSSHLISNVKSCDIRVHQIPSKSLKVAKAVREGNTTVFIDDKGKIYSTGIQNGFAFTPSWSAREKFANTYKALVKLGVIPEADAAEHLRQAQEIAARQDRKWEVDAIKKNAEKLGLKFTAAQLKKLESN